ncbi:helix-turn-helix transcriptional regulator [uncultured Vagococcus sp.]|uniref:helix-turn-helix domain-containing protein n=1 Tax=uncultured Vagococcus sp. TaxID=189676 RepID=UPI0028D1326F|nr:helix-turn-helix transcriptional regulator [uncultured Vagococcus sp.]
MNIAEQLKLARNQKGLTQQDVSEVLHVTRATISSWEVGRTYPSLDLLVDLSNLYDLSLDTLLKEDISMVEKVSKDVKQKRVYQRIFLGAVAVIALFLMVNIVWLMSNTMNYQYVEDNWDSDKKFYYLEKEGIKYTASKMNTRFLFRNSYLKKEPIWVMSWLTNPKDKNGYGLNMTVDNDNDISMLVEIGEKRTGGIIYVDSNMKYINHENTTDLLDELARPEELVKVKKFLVENKTELEKLYRSTKKQYDLVNN